MNDTSSPYGNDATPPATNLSFWWNNLLYLLQEQFWILLFVVVIVAVGDLLLFCSATRVYSSKGSLVVDQSPFQFTGNQGGTSDDSQLLLQSIISGIESEDMREIVAERLNIPPTNISFVGFDPKMQDLRDPDTVNIDASSERTTRVAVIEGQASNAQFGADAVNAVLDELNGLNQLAGRINNVNEQIKLVQQKVDRFSSEVSAGEAEYVALQQKEDGLKKHLAAGGSLASSPAFADDAGLFELTKKKIDADSAYHAQAQVSVRGEQLAALQGQDDSVNQQIDSYLHDREIGLDSATQEAAQKMSVFQAALTEQTDLLSELGNQKTTLMKAIGDFKLRRSLGLFNGKSPGSEADVIVILDRAHPALRPVKPNALVYGAAGLFLCLTLAPALMFLRHNLNQRIRSPLQIEWSTGVQCLAVLASSPGGSGKGGDRAASATFSGLTFLRNQLLRQKARGDVSQILAFTEIGPVNSSEYVVRLASLLAQADQATLLVNLDFDNPILGRELGLPSGPGLSEWVESTEPLDKFVGKTKFPKLGIIQPGHRADELESFLSRRPIAGHLEAMQANWPFILIYSPSLGRAPNLLLVAPPACSVLGLVHYNKSQLSELRDDIAQCDSYNLRFAGVVLHHYPIQGIYRNKLQVGSHRYIYELRNRPILG